MQKLLRQENKIMKYYAIIDTNVVVSAMLKGNSPPSTIVEFAFNGPIVPVLNKEIEI